MRFFQLFLHLCVFLLPAASGQYDRTIAAQWFSDLQCSVPVTRNGQTELPTTLPLATVGIPGTGSFDEYTSKCTAISPKSSIALKCQVFNGVKNMFPSFLTGSLYNNAVDCAAAETDRVIAGQKFIATLLLGSAEEKLVNFRTGKHDFKKPAVGSCVKVAGGVFGQKLFMRVNCPGATQASSPARVSNEAFDGAAELNSAATEEFEGATELEGEGELASFRSDRRASKKASRVSVKVEIL